MMPMPWFKPRISIPQEERLPVEVRTDDLHIR